MKRRAALLAAMLAASVGASAQGPAIPDAFTRADKGNCIACHAVPSSMAHPGGDVGPTLAGSRMRELGAATLRAALVDPMAANANTAMPPFGRHHILESQEIEAIVRFLQALPEGEPAYAEARAASDGTAAQAVLDKGLALWTRKFKDKRSLSGCFPNGGRRIAAVYPQYDARVKRVVTLEMAINQCLKAHHEAMLDALDPDMVAVVSYARSLSAGQKIAIKVPAAAQARLDEGRRLYSTRMGQRNFACASCHLQSAGKRYGDEVLSPLKGQAARPLDAGSGAVTTLQGRMRECLERMGAAPFAAGSDELNHLEYFIAYSSNGTAFGSRP